MRSILMSVQPQWCALSASGAKTIDVRRNRPRLDPPFKCYIYCTKPKEVLDNGLLRVCNGNLSIAPKGVYENAHLFISNFEVLSGKVIGEFVCDELIPIRVFKNGSIQNWMAYGLERACIPYEALANYVGAGRVGSGWHISQLVIYDTPRDLNEFIGLRETKLGYEPVTIQRAPQNWRYVEE